MTSWVICLGLPAVASICVTHKWMGNRKLWAESAKKAFRISSACSSLPSLQRILWSEHTSCKVPYCHHRNKRLDILICENWNFPRNWAVKIVCAILYITPWWFYNGRWWKDQRDTENRNMLIHNLNAFYCDKLMMVFEENPSWLFIKSCFNFSVLRSFEVHGSVTKIVGTRISFGLNVHLAIFHPREYRKIINAFFQNPLKPLNMFNCLILCRWSACGIAVKRIKHSTSQTIIVRYVLRHVSKHIANSSN